MAARNNITEYGGFSPTQALFPGYIPMDWSRLERPMTPEEKFQDESYKRILAQRAIQNSIFPLDKLLSHQFNFSNIELAFSKNLKREKGYIKGLFVPQNQ